MLSIPSLRWLRFWLNLTGLRGQSVHFLRAKLFSFQFPLPPVQLEMPLLTFAEFADAYHARWTVVRMWYEGWNKQSIAGCLKMARSHVYAIIEAFEHDGFEGLEDQRTRPFPHPDDQLTLPFLKEVLD